MRIQPVAFLGPEGTFSHLLARKRFGSRKALLPCPDLAAAFDFIGENPKAKAVVPIENSSGGTIYDTIDLLIKHSESIRVQEDLTLDVRLALAGHQEKKIKDIYSHFAPLHHHREWLLREFPGVRLHSLPSTALAAAKAKTSLSAAALASPGAAELYGLDILRYPIRPESINVTRFYLIGREDSVSSPDTPHKTTLVARLKNRCGSLHAFLGPFASGKVNLRMIVSRPIPGHPETYVFFLEIEGSLSNPAVARALKLGNRHCDSLEILGSFPTGKRFRS